MVLDLKQNVRCSQTSKNTVTMTVRGFSQDMHQHSFLEELTSDGGESLVSHKIILYKKHTQLYWQCGELSPRQVESIGHVGMSYKQWGQNHLLEATFV